MSSPATYYQWYLNGQPISGATNQAYTPTQDGNYSVEVRDANGCSSMSNSFPYTTAVNEATFGGKVSIYPNPTNSNEIEIYTLETITKISLINSIGQIVKEIAQPIFKQNTFKLNNLQQGFYFLQITAENGSLTKKIIVN
jgi:hypothetical protein